MAASTSKTMSLIDIILDLCGRFLIDVPEEEQDLSRVVFQIEQAWWFYLDFYREAQPTLPNMALRKFASMMFRHTPYLAGKVDQSDAAVDKFLKYKHSVPVCGAIILDESLTKCLLVKGYKSRSTWGFPKGKIDYEENKYDCAVREVFEETSFDIGPWASRTDYVDSNVGDQETRLYICAGAPLDAEFHPRTRKEIGEIKWHLVDELPTKPKEKRGYYMVYPYVHHIKKFIAGRKATGRQIQRKSHGPSVIITRKTKRTKDKAHLLPPKVVILDRRTLLPTPVSGQMVVGPPLIAIPERDVSIDRAGAQGIDHRPQAEPRGSTESAPVAGGAFVHCRAFQEFAFDVQAIAATLVWDA